MLFKIEATNLYSCKTEYYAVIANSEGEVKINFSLEYPSYKIRSVTSIEGKVVEIVE